MFLTSPFIDQAISLIDTRCERKRDLSTTVRLHLCEIDHLPFLVRRIINNAAW